MARIGESRNEVTMKNPFVFFEEARTEVRKVVWPTRNETAVSTIMVVLMVTLMAIFFGFVDFALRFGLAGIYKLFSG